MQATPSHAHPAEPRANAAKAVAVLQAAEGHDKTGDAAHPDGGAEDVQGAGGEHQGAVLEPCGGVGGGGGGEEDDGAEGEEDGGGRLGRAEQEGGKEQGGGHLHQPGHSEGRADDGGHGQVQRIREHRGLHRDGQRLAEGEAQGAPGGDARGAAGEAFAVGQRCGEGAGEEDEEQDAAERHALADDDEAVQDDREVAEQVDEQRHQGAFTVKGTSPRVMWPSTARTCQRRVHSPGSRAAPGRPGCRARRRRASGRQAGLCRGVRGGSGPGRCGS